MSTYPIKLTKVSDNSVHHSFMLAEGRDGQPRVRLGSREKEMAKAGQRGVIVIESLHRGSGQHVSRDPMMYEFADGMFSDSPGLVRAAGAQTTVATLATGQDFAWWSRATLTYNENVGGVNAPLVVTPTQIYENAAAKLAPLSGSHFTGSVARLGDHVYFGQQAESGWQAADYAGIYNANANTWSNNAGFKAAFLAEQAEKMWAVEGSPGLAEMKFKWTDDAGNATPIFATEFSYRSGRRFVRDIATVGPHAVIALTDARGRESFVLALDTAGAFTNLLSKLPPVEQFSSFLGGQILWFAGRPRGLWMRDIMGFTDVELGAVDVPRGSMGFPLVRLAQALTKGPVGIGVTALGREMFIGMYGTFTKRDGNAVSGSAIVHALLDSAGFHLHTIATPESVAALTNSHVMGIRLVPWEADNETENPTQPRQLQYVTGTPDANANQTTVKLHTMELWEGGVQPQSFDTRTKFLRTSRYAGDHWTTKRGELLRGYIAQLPASNTATVRVYLDGDSAETYNFSVNTVGPFAQSLPTNVIGRDIALDIETNANGSVVVEFPWSLDYFAVPDQKDIVRLCVLAGRDQVTMGGTLTDRTRAETLQDIEDVCASPEQWTLSWWDGTPDWDVIPLGYEGMDTEPAHVEGGGAAIAWLTLQRL